MFQHAQLPCRLLALTLGLLVACGDSATPNPAPRDEPGGHLIIAGVAIPTAAPVVNFLDEGGYDAGVETCWFDRDRVLPTNPARGCNVPRRWSERSTLGLKPAVAKAVDEGGWTRESLAAKIDQFVLHYDVAGTSRSCFKVLHDMRGLSVHFMLDLDGTVYQTMDLARRGRHATIANDRSIGIEIAQMGAYEDPKRLKQWYVPDGEGGTRIRLSKWQGDGHFRNRDYVPRPARPEPVSGRIHGHTFHQYDFTAAQYRSLVQLTRTLVRELPRIEAEAPRDAAGQVEQTMLSRERFTRFSGIIGHFHIQKNKYDPGPAFRWEDFLTAVRARDAVGPEFR